MHPASSYQLAQAHIADLRQHAQRAALARAARRARLVRRGHAGLMWPTLGRSRADRVRVRSSQMEIDYVYP